MADNSPLILRYHHTALSIAFKQYSLRNLHNIKAIGTNVHYTVNCTLYGKHKMEHIVVYYWATYVHYAYKRC